MKTKALALVVFLVVAFAMVTDRSKDSESGFAPGEIVNPFAGEVPSTAISLGEIEVCGNEAIRNARFGEQLVSGSAITAARIDDTAAAMNMYVQMDNTWYSFAYNLGEHPFIGRGTTLEADYLIWGSHFTYPEKMCRRIGQYHLHMINFYRGVVYYSQARLNQ